MIPQEVLEWLKDNIGFYLTLNACRDKSITVRIHRWDDPNGRGEFMDRTYGLANSGPNGEIDSTIQIAWLQAKSKMP